MNKKINIGVEELEEIEVGYDAAGGNMEVDQDEVPEGTLLFYDFVSSSSPLPVEDGHYDHIKYSHAWIWVDEGDKQGVADEFYRILSVGGTVFIRDYLARFDWEKGEDIELTHAQWMERLTTYFNESKWDIGPSMILADGFTVEITLTKKPEVTISYLEAVERAQQGTLPTCPHLEKVKVFKACYAECIIQYVFGTECNLPDDWKIEELGYLSYINMTNKDENLQRMIDEYMDGDAGSCREDCVHYKSCNE